MAVFENALTIRTPVDEVFAFIADFENIPAWNYAVDQTSKTSPGPVAVGTTYRQSRSIPDRSQESFTVTVFEPVRRLAIEGTIGPFPARLSYLLESVPGGTRLTNAVNLELRGALRLAGPVALPAVKAAVAANLEGLRQLLEARHPTAGSFRSRVPTPKHT